MTIRFTTADIDDAKKYLFPEGTTPLTMGVSVREQIKILVSYICIIDSFIDYVNCEPCEEFKKETKDFLEDHKKILKKIADKMTEMDRRY